MCGLGATGTVHLFQFTPLREGRLYQPGYFLKNAEISIHAPPRGATMRTALKVYAFTFQFTPLREGRRQSADWTESNSIFQFTPLREGRRRGANRHRGAGNFNSRPSARGDSSVQGLHKVHDNFNSRPSARGDTAGTHSRLNHGLFQFTPLREGRLSARAKQLCSASISIHAPPRGATPSLPSGRCR